MKILIFSPCLEVYLFFLCFSVEFALDWKIKNCLTRDDKNTYFVENGKKLSAGAGFDFSLAYITIVRNYIISKSYSCDPK